MPPHAFPKLESPVVLSPMAGVTDVAFRALAKRYGAGLTYTEFVSSAGIVRGNLSSSAMLRTAPEEKPVAVQLFGSNVEEVVAAAKMVQDSVLYTSTSCSITPEEGPSSSKFTAHTFSPVFESNA